MSHPGGKGLPGAHPQGHPGVAGYPPQGPRHYQHYPHQHGGAAVAHHPAHTDDTKFHFAGRKTRGHAT